MEMQSGAGRGGEPYVVFPSSPSLLCFGGSGCAGDSVEMRYLAHRPSCGRTAGTSVLNSARATSLRADAFALAGSVWAVV